jgi:NADH dehydrogenase
MTDPRRASVKFLATLTLAAVAAALPLKHAAQSILRQLKGQPMEPFSYWDRGMFSVIGRGSAVGIALERFRMSGYIAWLAWLFVHLIFLVGFRNKLSVFFQWTYAYFTYKRGARIITGVSGERSAGSS